MLLSQLPRDLRQGWRALRQAPFVSAVIVISLAIGIGVNTAVFSWLEAVVLKPIAGVRDASAVYLVEPRTAGGGHPGTSWLEFKDLQQQLPSFKDLAAFRMAPLDVGIADRSDRAYAMLVTGNYFTSLGLRAPLGRLLRAEDTARPGAEPVVVLSHRFWQARFNGSPAVIGQTLRVNDRPLSIVGVAPEGFQGTVVGMAFDLWVPSTIAPVLFDRSTELDARGERGVTVFGLLKPGVAREHAQAELDEAMRQLAHDYPVTNRTMAAEVLPFWQSPRGPQRFTASALAVLQAVMVLVLLVVCGNTANLVLARASSRRHEIGLRLAIGAGRWRIVSLLLSESLVLAAIGTALGIGLAVWATEAMRAVPMPTIVPIRFITEIDFDSCLFAAALGIVSAVVFGLAPALQLARMDPQPSIKAGGVQKRSGGRLTQILMAFEIGMALIVLVLAAVFLERFTKSQTTDPGFVREGVWLTTYDLRERNRNVDAPSSARFAADLLTRLKALPSLESAAISTQIPLDIHGLGTRAFTLEGHVRDDGDQEQALTNTVTPGYFQTMRIPFRQGQDFADLSDTSAPPQAIVNEEFVREYATDVPVLGRRIDSAGRTYAIVGVVANSAYQAFDEPPTPFIYLSYRDRPSPQGEIHLRPRASSTEVLNDVRRIVRGINVTLPLYNARTLRDHVDQNLVFQRIPARIFAVIGPLLVVLAAIGISAVVAHSVSDRRQEIGVRLALGATPVRVAAGVVLEMTWVIGAGAAVGWAIAFLIDRSLIQSDSFDLTRFVAVPALLLGVGVIACWVPAIRATRRGPMYALRSS